MDETRIKQVPNYKGLGEVVLNGLKTKLEVAVWVKKTKKGEQYLSLNIGGLNLAAFKNEPKEQVQQKPEPVPPSIEEVNMG
jgi:hypothetical protein